MYYTLFSLCICNQASISYDAFGLCVCIAICVTVVVLALLITSLIKWIEETRYAHTVAIEQHKAKEEMRISEIRLRRFLLDKKLDYLKGKEGYLEAINEYLEANDIDKQKEV